ncbi:MAG: methionyl-tRNA formyltransferase [Candidatus Nanopelagicales bacterium]
MRLVFAGTPEAAVPSLQALIDSRHDVVGVVSRPDARVGRGRKVQRSAVASRADEHGIPVLTPDHPRDAGFVAKLTELAPDCCPVVAYGALIPPAVLAIPRFGWVNLHFSLLPAWRGAAPVQHAIWHGDDITGATTFVLEEGLDTGPILGTVTESIGSSDTTGDLLARLAASGAQLLVHTIDALAQGDAVAVPQSADGVTFAPKIDVPEAHVDLGQPAIRVDRQVRACTPSPGAWVNFRGDRLGLDPVSIELGDVPDALRSRVDELASGELLAGKRHVWVGTATTAVCLSKVQPAGKKMMIAADWARGVRLEPHEGLT